MRSRERRAIPTIVILLSFSLSLAVVGGPVTQAASGTRIDYVAKLNELVKKGSDESLNAEPFYRKAAALCVESPPAVDVWSWPTDWSSGERSAVRYWVRANADALAQLRLGAQRPSYWFQYQDRSGWVKDCFGHLASVRLLVFALTYQAKLKAAEGMVQDAAEDTLLACRFALDMRRRLLLVEQLVGIAASNYALDTGFQILGRCTLDSSVLRRLQDCLTELSKDPAWLVDLKGEEIVMLQAVRHANAHSQGGPDGEDVKDLDRILTRQLSAMVKTRTSEELTGLVRGGCAYYASMVAKTPFQWKREGVESGQNWKGLPLGNVLLLELAPSISRAVELSFRTRSSKDALITTVALLRYKRDRSSLPTDLQGLISAGYVTQVPMDPYSDKLLIYRRTQDNFILYSVGVDFQDGEGKHDRKWGQGEQGGDYVFWPVRME